MGKLFSAMQEMRAIIRELEKAEGQGEKAQLKEKLQLAFNRVGEGIMDDENWDDLDKTTWEVLRDFGPDK